MLLRTRERGKTRERERENLKEKVREIGSWSAKGRGSISLSYVLCFREITKKGESLSECIKEPYREKKTKWRERERNEEEREREKQRGEKERERATLGTEWNERE